MLCCMVVKAQTPVNAPTDASPIPPSNTDTTIPTTPNADENNASPTSNVNENNTSPTTNLSNIENTDISSPTTNVETEQQIEPTSEDTAVDANNTGATEALDSPDPLEDIMESLQLQSYEYNPQGKRDPFFFFASRSRKGC